MSIDMLPLQILGLKKDLHCVIQSLRDLGCVQIEDLAKSPLIAARPLSLDRETLHMQEEMGFLIARIEGTIQVLGEEGCANASYLQADTFAEAREGIDELLPLVKELTVRRDKLQAELASLPRYEATLRKLLPIIPPSANEPGNITVGVLVSRSHVGVLDSIGNRILDLTHGRADVVASDVDASTRTMLIVFPREFAGDIEAILGQEDVSRLRLPVELGKGPPNVVLEKLHQRMREITEELAEIDRQLNRLAAKWSDRLATWRDVLRDQADANSVLSRFGETDMTFVLTGWVPEAEFDRVSETLRQEIGEALFIESLPLTAELKENAPVCLKNPRPAKHFESLVGLLSLPRYGHIDPTRLMALFMPIFFGMILGDVGYGLFLLAVSLLLMRRFRQGIAHDIAIVLAMGAGWSILFGLLFGEFFGTLGEHLGLHPLWFDRTSAEYVSALLIMTLVVGAVHISLGLILGVWEAIKAKSRTHMLERGGMLVGLISLFFIVAILTNNLPDGFMTPAIAGLILGIVLMGASLGWLGIVMGPIEFIGLIGNVLSYLRIAAIGLASVYLAKVANDTAGMTGILIVGVITAVLIHALNLVLGAFSPTIHSLRLHYVEFFRKFYEGGGRPYEPYKSALHLEDRFNNQ